MLYDTYFALLYRILLYRFRGGGSVALAGNIWPLESGRSQPHKKGGIIKI